MRNSRFILVVLLSAYFCAAFVAQTASIVMPAAGRGNLELQSLEPLPVKGPQNRIDVKKHVFRRRLPSLCHLLSGHLNGAIPVCIDSGLSDSNRITLPFTTSSAERGPLLFDRRG